MKEVTILIPTHNRPNYLKRLLDYYSSYQIDYKIIVADSSSDENKVLNKKIISFFSSLNILYLNHYDDKINPANKLVNALNYVESKYCLFCADDDFITPSGIKNSVSFLRDNPDFSVAQGHFLSSFKGWHKKYYWALAYPEAKSIIFSDAGARIKEYLINYYPNFYGVYKADFLKMIFEETLKNTNDVRFGEILPALISLAYGKIKYLDVLYGVYGVITDSTTVKGEKFIDFIKEGTYNEKYKKFNNCLTGHLSKNSLLGIKEAKKLIDEGMVIFLKKHEHNLKNFKHFLINKTRRFLNSLPSSISKKIRFLHAELIFRFRKKEEDFLKSLNDPSSKYYEDFNRIKNCLTSHEI